MTQYKSVKITTQDYDTLKRYMHLGFQDSMTEAFHKAINTAMFEEYGEPTPQEQRKEWERPSILPQQDHEGAAKPTTHRGRPKGVKDSVPRTKRHHKRQTKGKKQKTA